MRQKDNYFGSILERSKTPVLPRPVSTYVTPLLHNQRNREANEDLESFAVSSASVDKSPDYLVSSSHNELFPEKNIASKESASSLGIGHYELKTKKVFLKTDVTSGKDMTGKSNDKDNSMRLLKEKGSSIPALKARGNTQEIGDFISVSAIPLKNIKDESSLDNKRVKGKEEGNDSVNIRSPDAAYLSEKELDFPLQLHNQRYWKTNESLKPSVKIEKPAKEIIMDDMAGESNNRDGSTKFLKEKTSFILERGMENISDMRNSSLVPMSGGSVTGKEPSLIIKKIDIQIVDNRQPNKARIKKIDPIESDVLNKNYLWRFNIS